MRSENEHDDLLSYTKAWLNKVDRGGLFPICITVRGCIKGADTRVYYLFINAGS